MTAFSSDWEACRDVRSWRETDLQTALRNVCYHGQSGSHMLAIVLILKFVGLQIDSMIADSPDFGEDWLWVDALPRWG
jgi:hypothetical protein